MSKIVTFATDTKELRLTKKTVLVGGCFDILHQGHHTFLTEAKKQGDYLAVLLESDSKITKLKGESRPINSQQIRAQNLAKLEIADLIIMLTHLESDSDYDNVLFKLKPAIIATTLGDPYRFHKERQAKAIGAKVIDVTPRLPELSTTKLLKKYE